MVRRAFYIKDRFVAGRPLAGPAQTPGGVCC